ncbi:hypothetical protein ACVB9K_09560, partial [Streptococcus infantarius]
RDIEVWVFGKKLLRVGNRINCCCGFFFFCFGLPRFKKWVEVLIITFEGVCFMKKAKKKTLFHFFFGGGNKKKTNPKKFASQIELTTPVFET